MTAARIAMAISLVLGVQQVPRDAPDVSRRLALSWHVPGEGRGRPVVDAKHVYFLSSGNTVTAVEAHAGHVRWRAPVGPRETAEGLGVGPRLALAGPVVIGGGDTLTALDRVSGSARWVFAPAADHGMGFYLGDSAETVTVAGSASGALFALDGTAGAILWRTRAGGPRTTVYAPVVSGGEVAATYRDFDEPNNTGLVVVELATGAERWRRQLPSSSKASPPVPTTGALAVDDEAWFVSGHDGAIHAFAKRRGDLAWSTPPSDSPDYRPLVVADAVVIAGSLSGDVTAYDRETGVRVWNVRPASASVAFEMNTAPGVVYVPFLSGVVVGLSTADGTEVWRSDGPGFRYAPGVSPQALFLSSSVSGFFRATAGHGVEVDRTLLRRREWMS